IQAKADTPASLTQHPGTTVTPDVQAQVDAAQTSSTPTVQAQADSTQSGSTAPQVQAKADAPASLSQHPGTTVTPDVQAQVDSAQASSKSSPDRRGILPLMKKGWDGLTRKISELGASNSSAPVETPNVQAKSDAPKSLSQHPGTTVTPDVQAQLTDTPESSEVPSVQAKADSTKPQPPQVQAKADPSQPVQPQSSSPQVQAKSAPPASLAQHPGTIVTPELQAQLADTSPSPETPSLQAKIDPSKPVQSQTSSPQVQAKSDAPASLSQHPGTVIPPSIEQQINRSPDPFPIQAKAEIPQQHGSQTPQVQAKSEPPTSLSQHPGTATPGTDRPQSPSTQPSKPSSKSRSQKTSLARPALSDRVQRQSQQATVLNNLGQLKPIGQKQNMQPEGSDRSAAAFPPVVQRKSDGKRPNDGHPGTTTSGSWANVEDLLRQTSPTPQSQLQGEPNASPTIQRQSTPGSGKQTTASPDSWSNIEDLLRKTAPPSTSTPTSDHSTSPNLQAKSVSSAPTAPSQPSGANTPPNIQAKATPEQPTGRKRPRDNHPGTSPESLTNLSQLAGRSGAKSDNQPSIRRSSANKSTQKDKKISKKSLGQSKSLQSKSLGKGKNKKPLGKKASKSKSSGWSDLSDQMTKVAPGVQRQAQAEGSEQEQIFTPQGIKTVPRRQSYNYTLQRAPDAAASGGTTAEASPEQAEDYLEALAQEIYNIVREEIAIEQERMGRGYSGRLPW
ncbi:MAG: hypothetical protein F6J87_28365, partial [Spirulina sp. SIO3F2]|nr:hypothetical protein [Spirulina sp. SIO3F2]